MIVVSAASSNGEFVIGNILPLPLPLGRLPVEDPNEPLAEDFCSCLSVVDWEGPLSRGYMSETSPGTVLGVDSHLFLGPVGSPGELCTWE